jgi:multidrug efflux pump
LKPDRMAALNVTPSQLRAALTANNYLAAAGSVKGALGRCRSPLPPTCARSKGSRSWCLRGRTGAGPPGRRWRTSLLGADDSIRTSASPARRRCSWASGCCQRSPLDLIARVNAEVSSGSRTAPDGMSARVPL